MLQIPFEDLSAVNAPMAKELEAAASRVIRSGRYVLGEEVAAFEREFAEYIGVKHCIGVNSGLDALTLSLISLNLETGAEVLLPANTFVATALSVIHAGLRPVLVDPEISTFNIDPARIEEAITAKTKVLITVHLYGRPADMDKLTEICDRHGIILIEDAAQAHGAEYKGQKVGSVGMLSAFSFYPVKSLGALGDAGVVLTNNEELAERLKELRNYGSSVKYHYKSLGHNSRLDEMQAAFLRVKLNHLDRSNTRKRALAKRYCEFLDGNLQRPDYDEGAVYHVYPILHKDRDSLREQLAEKGIGTGLHYPQPFYLQQPFVPMFRGRNFPITEHICAGELSLPISVSLRDEDQDAVIAAINKMAISD